MCAYAVVCVSLRVCLCVGVGACVCDCVLCVLVCVGVCVSARSTLSAVSVKTAEIEQLYQV